MSTVGNVLKAIKFLEERTPKYFPRVPRITGEILRVVTFLASSNFDFLRIVDVGAGYGYSTLWLYLGALESSKDFEVLAIEISKRRAEFIRKIADLYGLKNIFVFEEDAKKALSRIEPPIHVVFLDAEKRMYGRYLEIILEKIPLKGIVMAHNVIGFRNTMRKFLAMISDVSKWKTIIFSGDSEGLSISIKIGGDNGY